MKVGKEMTAVLCVEWGHSKCSCTCTMYSISLLHLLINIDQGHTVMKTIMVTWLLVKCAAAAVCCCCQHAIARHMTATVSR